MKFPFFSWVRYHRSVLKSITIFTLVIFCWAFIFPVALAAKEASERSGRTGTETQEKRVSDEEELSGTLEEVEEKLGKLEEKLAKGEDDSLEKDDLKKLKKKLQKLDQKAKENFQKIEKDMKGKKLPQVILDRHYQAEAVYQTEVQTLLNNLEDVEGAWADGDRKIKAKKAKEHLEKKQKRRKHTPVDPDNLPHRTPRIKKQEPRLKKEEYSEFQKPILLAYNGDPSSFLMAQATQDLPAPEDLNETIEVQFTQAIRDLTAQLNNDPIKIYEWVRNNIEFVPTYGSVQGADMCLQTKQCNDFDTASLLIALLRASNISARYVYGTIELPIEKVMNWVGGFTDATSAVNFIASGGIPIKAYTSNGKISKVYMEHVWVETYIPYGNYRGTMQDQSGKTWIPMDGSYKQYTYTTGFDITSAVAFDQTAYLGQVQTKNPVHYYQDHIQAYLDANMPDKTIIDVKGNREITNEIYHLLPSTLPYKTVAILSKYSSISSSMRATITFTLSDPYGFSTASYTTSTPEAAGKRITISYTPATTSDEALVSSYGGYMYAVPAYLLNLKAVLKIEGSATLTGETTQMGSEQTLSIQFSPPNATSESTQKNLIAGTYYAIGLDLQGVNEDVLGKRNYTMTTNVLSQTAAALGNDDLIGEHLQILATTYFLANDKIYRSGAKIYNVAQTRILSEGITSFSLSVSYLFSIPINVTPSGVEIDVAMDRQVAISKEGNTAKEKAYVEIAGLTSSYHEHDIFERIDEFSSVSAVRALQVASTNGTPIYQINSTNIGQTLSMLQISPEAKTDIQNTVNTGKEVTISQTNVQIYDWIGVGYIIKDPVTGAGAYMISGGLAGGGSTSKADGNQIVQLHKEPNGWVKDRVDPMTRKTIVLAAQIEIGEEIVATAEEKMEEKISYIKIGRCTGLVISAYKAAGIDFRKLAKEAGTGDPGNVSELYLLVKNKPEFWIGSGEPILGDIIFFKDTYSRPESMRRAGDNNVTHIGIVSEIINGKVRSMIHAANEKRNIAEDIFAVDINSNTYWGPKLLGLGRPR